MTFPYQIGVPVETALLLAENKGRGEREGILGDCKRRKGGTVDVRVGT